MLSRVVVLSAGEAAPPPAGLSVYVTPSTSNRAVSNGSYTTPQFSAVASGGSPPYTYQWESNEGVINSATSSETTITLSGFNEIIYTPLTVTVTDSLLATANDSADVFARFGTLV